MRIFFLSFYGGMNQRGVERWVYELATRLSEFHKIAVFQNMPLEVDTKYDIKISDISYDSKKRSKNLLLRHLFIDYDSLRILVFNIKILKSLLKENYDIIIPTDGGWEPAIVRIITWFRRKKMVVVGHAGIGWDDANNLWCLPDIFVALSSYAGSWAKRVNPFVRSVIIPDGVDLKEFNSEGNKIKLPLRRPIALCVSALEKGKRVELIIRTVAETGNMSLLICGRGEKKEQLYKLGKKLLGNRFDLKEYDFQKMPQVYRSADLFISASLPHYSFEMVIVEALSCNLPIVANNDPIRKEIVGNAGILTNPTSINEFSKSIKKVMDTNWGTKPQEQAKIYSWEKVENMYLNLFNSLIKG